MASLRAFTDVAVNWDGCGRDSFDFDTDRLLFDARKHATTENASQLLAGMIENHVIPQIVGAHKSSEIVKNRPNVGKVIEFIDILISKDVAVAAAFVEEAVNNGATLEVVFLDIFSPAARLLGKLWEEDVCDFTDVTIALSRLQQLLRELGAAFDIEACPVQSGRRALLVAAPEDQHTFGVFMLQEFFRRAGWDVEGGVIASQDELLSLVENNPYDLVGLSVSNEIVVDAFASAIRSIRKVGRSPGMKVLVGGRFFLDHPDCVSGVGADATAQDGRRAVLAVSSLLGSRMLS